MQTDFAEIAEENAEVRTPEAADFHKQLNFTSVRTLSPRDPALLALARLPIAVPFHSIIGQKQRRRRKRWRGSLCELASRRRNSELIVRSGHNAFNNAEARSEVIRILREELRHRRPPKQRSATMLASYAEERNMVFQKSAAAARRLVT